MKIPSVVLAITLCSTIHAFQSVTPGRWSNTKKSQVVVGREENPRATSTTSLSPLFSNVPELLGDASQYNSNNDMHAPKPPLPLNPKGVVFDMDGTLIEHVIDFANMRRRIYQVADEDITGKTLERTCVLELATKLSPEGQIKAGKIFEQIEQKALEDMKLKSGAAELLEFLHDNGINRAVLTRNMERNVVHMCGMYGAEFEKGGKIIDSEAIFHPIVARNTKAHPDDEMPIKSKPLPDGILHICSVWGCDPSEVIMVGDSANDDMSAANRAGCGGAVLLTQPGGKQLDTDSGYSVGDSEEEIRERTPSLVVESLLELRDCLEAVLAEREKRSSGVKKNNELVYNFPNSEYSVVIPGINVRNV